MTRYIIGDLRTGRRLLDVPVMAGPWDNRLDTPETVSVTVDMNDPDVRALSLENTATPTKSFLGVIEGDRIMGCGPIWTHSYDRDAGTLQLGAKGLGSVFDHRSIIPLIAASLPVDQWTVPDPTDSTKTMTNPLLQSAYTGLWLGSIAKRLVQQALTWTGGNLPIVLPAEEASSNTDHERTYDGVEFKPVGEALAQLTQVDGGPEWRFTPRFTTDGLGVEWVMEVGTAAQPLLFSTTHPQWDVTANQSPVSAYKVDLDGSTMASLAWATGGRSADKVLVARSYDPTLVDAGYTLLELVDSTHTTVEKQSTLDAYVRSVAGQGKKPTSTVSFDVKAYPTEEDGETPAGPQLGSYSVGDFCDLMFAEFDPDRGIGDPYQTAAGSFTHRILGLSGDEKGLTVSVSCAPEVS